MIYATAFDDITNTRHLSGTGGTRPGLAGIGYATTNPFTGATMDLPIACGVDQNGNSWVSVSNQYYYDPRSLYNYVNAAGVNARMSGADANTVAAGVVLNAIMQAIPSQYGNNTQVGLMNVQMNSIVGQLRNYGVPFTAYVPPPAPTPPAPPQPPPAPSGSTPSTTQKTGQMITLTNIDGKWFGRIGFDDSSPLMLTISDGGPNGPWRDVNGSLIDMSYIRVPAYLTDQMPASMANYVAGQPYRLPAMTNTAPPPAGFSIINSWAPRSNAWPVFVIPPVHDLSSNTWSFSGGAPFTSTTAIGLDAQKLALGIYAERETDLGTLNFYNGRSYELWQTDFYDLVTNKPAATVFYTVEGGGGSLLIPDPLYLASRIIVDVSTYGTAEGARASAHAAGVSEQNIKLATEAGAALATVIAVGGTAIVAAGGGVGAGAAAAAPDTTGLLTGSETATFATGTTETGTGLIAASAPTATEIGAGAGATAAATPSAIGATAAAATSVISKAVGGAILAAGTAAVTTEIKKLTGQLPKPPGTYVPGMQASVQAPSAPSSLSSTAKTLLAAGAAILLLGKKS